MGVAIGFSDDTLIGDDSVSECVWKKNDGVMEIEQSYNVDEVENNRYRDENGGLSEKKGKLSNGRVRCSFKRTKQLAAINEIYDLDKPYHLVLAQGKVDKNG